MKLAAVPLVLVPGMAQIRRGAPGVGVLLFCLFILALNGYFLSRLMASGDAPARWLGFGAALLWVVSLIDGIRRISRTRA